MPSDDLILNVRQISQYPPLGVVPPSFSLVLQSAIGGPYYSASASALVATALSTGDASLGVGMAAPADAFPGIAFASELVVGYDRGIYWNAYPTAGGGPENYLTAGDAGALGFDPTNGWQFSYVPPGVAGAPVPPWLRQLTITPAGYLEVGDQVLLARDPAGPMEAATAQWVEGVVAGLRAQTVWTFNGRRGDVFFSIDDILGAGGAPIYSPRFQGSPRADTPALSSCSSRLATTAFVHLASMAYVDNLLATHPFVFKFNGRTGDVELTWDDLAAAGALTAENAALTGVPTAPTAPIGSDSTQIATTAFVVNAINGRLQGEPGGLFAPTASPIFNGIPQGPTAATGTATGQLATTAFVMNAVADSVAGVATFNTRAGNVTLEASDIDGAGGALLASPNFTGNPTAPTVAVGDASNAIATTAWVLNEIGGAEIGVMSFNGRGGAVVLNMTDITNAGGVGAISPVFSGTPTAPTATTGTNTQQIATTAFVMGAISAHGVTSFNTRTGAVTLNSADISAAGGAPSASPTLTGVPLAPTAAPSTSTQQIATTAFVGAAVAAAAGVTSFNTRQGAVTLTSADVNAPAAGGPYLSVAVANQRQNRNRLDNGDFRINQWQLWMPSGGLAQPVNLPPGGVYTDRWGMTMPQANIIAVQQPSVVGVALASTCLQFYSLSAYNPAASDPIILSQSIEFINTGDWQMGTAAATPLTLSFLARASVAGTFSVSIVSGGGNGGAGPFRSYIMTYTLTAGVWTPVAFVIPGDGVAGAGGTWLRPDGGNMAGATLRFDLGSGSNWQTATTNAWQTGNYISTPSSTKFCALGGNANISFANIQLETGAQQTPFDVKMVAQTFQDCRRYYQAGNAQLAGVPGGSGLFAMTFPFQPPMRAIPSVSATKIVSSANATDIAMYGSYADAGQLAFTATGAGLAFNVNVEWAADAQF